MLTDENSLNITCSQWHPGDEEWVAKASVAADLTPVNCGDCALPTCTACAVKLIDGEKRIEDCPALTSDEGRDSAAALRQMGLA